MKVAIITSARDLNKFENYGDIGMALTHIVLKDEMYATYYRSQSEKGRFNILDCSAFELQESTGKGLNADLVLEAANRIKASEVICTDVLFDGEATIGSTKEFLNQCDKKYGQNKPFKLFSVPQGRSIEEWVNCFKELLKFAPISTIGLSKLGVPSAILGEWKSSGNATKSRIELLEFLLKNCQRELNAMYMTKMQFHCLGADNEIGIELIHHEEFNRRCFKECQTKHLEYYPIVRSIDTSMPYWYGCFEDKLDEKGIVKKLRLEKPFLETGSIEDDIEGGWDADDADIRINCILHNICTVHKLSKG